MAGKEALDVRVTEVAPTNKFPPLFMVVVVEVTLPLYSPVPHPYPGSCKAGPTT